MTIWRVPARADRARIDDVQFYRRRFGFHAFIATRGPARNVDGFKFTANLRHGSQTAPL